MKSVCQILFLISTFGFSLATEAQNSNDLYAKNKSEPTNCAESDNINVPIFSTVAQESAMAPYLELKATHPSFINSITTSKCPEDNSGSDCQKSQPNVTPIPYPGNGWETLYDDKGTITAYCKKLFDDHISNRFDICRTPLTWWRNRDMNVSIDQISETGSYIKLIKKISDVNSWPEVMVLYEDGNLRFKPHPPKNLTDVCFGSSVIVGPAPEDTTRPFVDIDQVTIDPSNLCLDISYLNGGSAHLCLAVDRTEARVIVNPNYGITTPVATFRSMWVSDGNAVTDGIADVDHIKSGDIRYPVLGQWDRLDGSNFFFSRSTKSKHNPSAPDIAINLFAAEPLSCLFNWAETSYPNLFSPSGAITQTDSDYSYRNYTNSFLGVSSSNNHVYYRSGGTALQDVGDVSDWLIKSGCFVATSELRECLFNWAETSYPHLLSPGGAITQFQPPYRYRYYQTTNSYVGVSSDDNHVYYLPANAPLQDVGGIYGWLTQASCH